jgi:hypothetical protein
MMAWIQAYMYQLVTLFSRPAGLRAQQARTSKLGPFDFLRTKELSAGAAAYPDAASCSAANPPTINRTAIIQMMTDEQVCTRAFSGSISAWKHP